MVAEPQRLLGGMPHSTGLKTSEPDGLFLSSQDPFSGKGDIEIRERPAQSCESELKSKLREKGPIQAHTASELVAAEGFAPVPRLTGLLGSVLQQGAATAGTQA